MYAETRFVSVTALIRNVCMFPSLLWLCLSEYKQFMYETRVAGETWWRHSFCILNLFKTGFDELKDKAPVLKNCDGMVRVTPSLRLNTCGESRQYANFSAEVTMTTAHVLKGCDRETYDASGVFKMCNVNKTLDLLPSSYRDQTWMAGVLSDKNIDGRSLLEPKPLG